MQSGMGPRPESIEREVHRAKKRKGATPSDDIIKKVRWELEQNCRQRAERNLELISVQG
jgi:hypothetical protein